MRILDRLRSTQVSPLATAICITVLFVTALAIAIAAKNIASRPTRDDRKRPVAKASRASVRVTETKAKPKVQEKPAAPGKLKCERTKKDTPKVDPYDVIVSRNLFRPVGSGGQANQPAGQAPSPQAGMKERGGAAGSLLPMPIPALPAWPGSGGPPGGRAPQSVKNIAFTGIVKTPSETQAMLENLDTKEVRFVGQGGNAFGCRVASISPQSVSLDKDGAQFTLALGENKTDAQPAAAASKPAGGPPVGSPGGPPSGPPDGGKPPQK